jgi:hypothetical protein
LFSRATFVCLLAPNEHNSTLFSHPQSIRVCVCAARAEKEWRADESYYYCDVSPTTCTSSRSRPALAALLMAWLRGLTPAARASAGASTPHTHTCTHSLLLALVLTLCSTARRLLPGQISFPHAYCSRPPAPLAGCAAFHDQINFSLPLWCWLAGWPAALKFSHVRFTFILN